MGYPKNPNRRLQRCREFLRGKIPQILAGIIDLGLYDHKTLNWDICIPACLFGYRSSVCDSTGFSPFFLESGRDPRLPASLNMIVTRYEDTNEYAQSVVTRLQDAWAAARRIQAEATLRNYANRPRGYAVTFEIGCLVDVWMRASIEH